MPSKLTRRRCLGGLAGASAAGLAGYRFLPANLLPDPVLEQRIERRSVPEVDTSLSVSPDALADSRSHLRDVIDRAAAAWDEVDDLDVKTQNEEFDRSLERTLDTARERLDQSEGADPTTDALRSLRFGVNRGAWSLAAARAIADDYDPVKLGERSVALHRDANDFSAATRYEVADPRRGLAYLYRTERALYFARLKAYGRVYISGETVAKSAYSYREAVEVIRGAIEGRRWLGDAKAIDEARRSSLADAEETVDLEPRLERAWRRCAARIDDLLPDRETAIERYFTDSETARGWATNRLFGNGYSAADDAYHPSNGLETGLLARTAVEHAKALQHARGFRSAMAHLDREFADGGVDLRVVASTKRRAVARLRDLLADSDDPLTRELAARPREEIVIGDWPLGVNPVSDSEFPRAEAYAMYLLAAENLRHTPAVRDVLLP